MIDAELISLAEPTEVRTFPKGRFEVYRVGPMTIGRATYEPGWRWSEHVGAASGERSARSSTSASSRAVRPWR